MTVGSARDGKGEVSMKLKYLASAAAFGLLALAGCQQQDAATSTEAPAAETTTTEAATTTPASLPCGVIDQRNWTAEFSAGARATLAISGEVDLPRPGYSVSLARDPADSANSTEPHLLLTITPPSTPSADVVTPHPVRYFGPASVLYTTVHITCDDAPLTDVAVPPPH